MKIEVREIGDQASRIIIIDDLTPSPERVVDLAAGLAPFPTKEADSFYPGLRRNIRQGPAFGYVDWVCGTLGPLLPQVYPITTFRITDAAFSLVTQPEHSLNALQSVPHFDNADPNGFAILHYLSPFPSGGTGFYRHRSTGFERITEDRVDRFRAALDADYGPTGGPPSGYFSGSTPVFEETARFDAVYNRALVYQGCLLHSGLLPETFNFSPDPRLGRLTGNIFIVGQ
jgi:hypothetical protein